MTNWTLADEYYRKALIRRKALQVLHQEGGYADVVRESQELVELVLKGVLRIMGIDPPKWHDVGGILSENQTLLPPSLRADLERIVKLSAALRKERELSFYGDDDFIPSQHYQVSDSTRCLHDVDWLLGVVKPVFERKG